MKNGRVGLMRTMYSVICPFRKAYWFVVRPKTSGAKCLVEHDGKILMLRNTYGKRYWTFPGGYIEKGEDPKDAAIRETREEVGIEVADPQFLGSYFSNGEYKRDTVYCFMAHTPSDVFTIDPIEIAEARWVSLDNLPLPRGPYAEKIIEMYKVKL